MRTFIIFLSFFVMALSLTQYGLVSAESGTSDDGDKFSLKDSWEKIKNYFDKLGLEIKEKYAKFGEWLKKSVGEALEKAKDKKEKLQIVAEDYKKSVKDLHEDLRDQGLEYLRQYKDQLGELWEEVKKAFKEAGGDLKNIDE